MYLGSLCREEVHGEGVEHVKVVMLETVVSVVFAVIKSSMVERGH